MAALRQRIVAAAMVVVAGVSTYVMSPNGTVELQRQEGTVNQAYADPAHGWAVPTICTGHTRTARKGMWLSDEQCLDLLKEDTQVAATALTRLSAGTALTQGEVDAYTSFIFNVGEGAFASSTLRKRLLAGDRYGACMQLLRWTQAGGKVLKGLVNRRWSEYNTCVSDLGR